MAAVHATGTRPTRLVRVALVVAATWSAALVASGFVVPVYRSDSIDSQGAASSGGETLVAVNGLGVVAVLVVPLVVTVLVAAALLVPDRKPVSAVAWTLTVLLAGFNLLAMLSIGVLVVPVTAALVVACAASSRGVAS